ncbi:MAG TPA: DNA primase [Moraxellaceae bacterium]|nr:DNA primase [Moraxellaceae bacterium]
MAWAAPDAMMAAARGFYESLGLIMAYGRIPEAFIDDVLLRADIVDLVDSRVKLKKAGKNYSACCPFHREKTPSFTVSREKQFYYCFGCGASGNAISFLMEYEHKGFLDALKDLAQRVGLEVPDTRDPDAPPRESHQGLYDMLERAAQYFEQQLRQHRDKDKAVRYFKKRGLTGQIAKHYRLGYAPAGWDNLVGTLGSDAESRQTLLTTGLVIQRDGSDRVYDAMRDRVIFPIRDFRGRVIAFGGRVLTDEKPKYLNSPESPVFHKGQELYGLYEARQAPGKLERVIVVEGYMDVVALAQYGITYAVATLGTATSTTHVERLFRLVPEIVFCFDGDAAGRKAAWRALESALPALVDGKSASFLFLPTDEDPDSLVRKEGKDRFVDRMINEAEPLADFLMRHLGEGLKLDSLEGRSRLAMLAKPLVATLPDGLYREMLLGRLAELTHLERDTLRAAVLETTPIAATRPASPVPAGSSAGGTAVPASADFAPPDAEGFGPPGWFGEDEDDDYGYGESRGGFGGKGKPWGRGGAGKGRGFGERRFGRERPRRPAAQRPPAVGLAERAVRLLLQDPAQAQLTNPAEVLSWGQAPDSLLVQLLEVLAANPGISTPALLGLWHGSPQGDELGSLAASEFLTPHTGVDREFQDLLRQLRMESLQAQLASAHGRLSQLTDFALARTELAEIERIKTELERLRRLAAAGSDGQDA